jgi:hypothetical protein
LLFCDLLCAFCCRLPAHRRRFDHLVHQHLNTRLGSYLQGPTAKPTPLRSTPCTFDRGERIQRPFLAGARSLLLFQPFVYIVAGRYFVRGLMAGSVKG